MIDREDVSKIVETVGRAVGAYGSLAFKEMINNCMSLDLSWKVSQSFKLFLLCV